jgi:hypothetical protein
MSLDDVWNWYSSHSDKINPIVAGLGGAALVWAAIQQARTATRAITNRRGLYRLRVLGHRIEPYAALARG